MASNHEIGIVSSIPPTDYRALPRLACPSGYVCVVRDVDSDKYRIDKSDHPLAFVSQVLAKRAGDFGIELVSVVQTSDVTAFESLLRERYGASLGPDWMSLDDYQLRVLHSSVLQIGAFDSCYLQAEHRDQALASAGAAPSRDAVNRTTGRATLQRPRSNGQGAAERGRLGTRSRIRTRSELWNQDLPPERAGLRQRVDDKINHLFVNDPVLLVAIVILIAFVLLFALVALFTNDPTWRYPTVIR